MCINAVVVGGVGLGESHLGIALGYAAAEAGFHVRFATAIDIINSLLAARNAGRLAQELKKYTRPDLLVMDELGYRIRAPRHHEYMDDARHVGYAFPLG